MIRKNGLSDIGKLVCSVDTSYPINLYKDTIIELLEDLEVGNATYYEDKIHFLAEKHNVKL